MGVCLFGVPAKKAEILWFLWRQVTVTLTVYMDYGGETQGSAVWPPVRKKHCWVRTVTLQNNIYDKFPQWQPQLSPSPSQSCSRI